MFDPVRNKVVTDEEKMDVCLRLSVAFAEFGQALKPAFTPGQWPIVEKALGQLMRDIGELIEDYDLPDPDEMPELN